VQGNLNDLLKELPPELSRTVARYGVRLAIDLLQTLYNDLGGERETVKSARTKITIDLAGDGQPKKRLGRPPKKAKKSGWSGDPEERRRQMAARIEVRAAKLRKEKLGAAARKRWGKKSAAERKTWLRNMQRGRKSRKQAKQPVVHLAAAS